MKDWNVNDPKSPSYIKNRSHWKEDGKEMTVGGPNCGIFRGFSGSEFQGPVVEFLYVDGSQIAVDLDANTSVPIYGETIIEIMYSEPDENHVRTVISYRPVEVFYDMYCTTAANYLGLGYRDERMVVYAIKTDSYNSYSNLTAVWDSYEIGEVEYECTEAMNWETLYHPTAEQTTKLQNFLRDHAYGFAGGYILMADNMSYDEGGAIKGGTRSVSNNAAIKIFNPGEAWMNYWNPNNPGENQMPIFVLNGSSVIDGQYSFTAMPAEDPSNPGLTTLNSLYTEKAASAKCSDMGIGELGKYTPATYHTIPLECLPQEIQSLYAWYLENYDMITDSNSGGMEEPILA